MGGGAGCPVPTFALWSLIIVSEQHALHGGGKSLENADYRTAVGLAVDILCKATVTHLELTDDKIQWADYT